MLDWLMTPIDLGRAHDVGLLLSWHGRAMVVAWGVLMPLGVAAAAAFKVVPGQDWPRQLDNRTWWNTHRFTMVVALVLTGAGIGLVKATAERATSLTDWAFLHGWLGWSVAALACLQFLSARLRGTKGGPTDPAGERGDHFDMTRRRRIFQLVHKTTGYAVVVLSMATILTGLWQANAPRWMWLALLVWWPFLLVVGLAWRRSRPISTYQAIWGPDPSLPGNAK